jgi:hypothetical protein
MFAEDGGGGIVWKLIVGCAFVLCQIDASVADDMIYNGLHCNRLCQMWMGISPERPTQQKRVCSHIVSHPAQYDADLVQLCHIVSGKRGP